ncbi:cell division control protein 10 [Piedraia hortae CBS 480.64]|uniref:Cell division control protein 10 n=1 Tax=Piedraia hortae CBS 480.64 TaxID=1314780 RepID=A0A6A7C8M6_9PEZI|nr:cell division control protein 10 [Piedraia hortae CBS 480.64]
MVEVVQPRAYVGFDSITTQIQHKLVKRGFQLNVMCVGPTGLGKSTLINTLFASQLAKSHGRLEAQEAIRQTTDISLTSHVIEENGVTLRLNIVDTPGFGDHVNNDRCWEPITRYIKDQHSTYLRKELSAHRDRHIPDTRIHCCLYFISPTGHSLKPIDIVVLKKLCETVNVVPVIAKSDGLTIEERQLFKDRIREEFAFHNIRLYPYESDEYNSEEVAMHAQIKAILPFAVVGSEKTMEVDGQLVRGRKHRFGIVNVEDENHCEFVYLRDFLIRTHLHDLIETTSHIHYESYRSKQLHSLRENNSGGNRPMSPATDREMSRHSQHGVNGY